MSNSTLPPSERPTLGRARALADEGQHEAALALLEPLFAAHPDDLDVGTLYQDCDRALTVEIPGDAVDAQARFRTAWRARNDADPSVASCVLAARAETDPDAALFLLKNALEIDPRCAWAHYGTAHAELQKRSQYRWREAREALARALASDPGHVPSRRLEAWMAAQEGTPGATAALERWVESTLFDPRVGHRTRVAMQLDLATRWILEGRSRPAAQLLEALEGEPHERARRLTLLAVALQEQGDPEAALEAAIRARATTDDTLPLVQEAILHEYALGDVELAMQRWAEVAERAGQSGELSGLLQQLRARVRLERAGAARED